MPELESSINLISFWITIYTWGAAGALLLFLFFIAQFYEKKSGQRAYYPAFLVSIVLFAVAAYFYAPLAPAITGNFWGDLARFAGGVMVIIFGLLLFKLMMGGRA
ncbi:MAG: hypothetical protein JW953_19095 [Anaerolineae bacterium]|nr:hypothetical protein [Anaerolineae bacterium]